MLFLIFHQRKNEALSEIKNKTANFSPDTTKPPKWRLEYLRFYISVLI